VNNTDISKTQEIGLKKCSKKMIFQNINPKVLIKLLITLQIF